MSKQTTEPTAPENTVRTSHKREVTATVTATAVTVVLGIVANMFINKAAAQVSDRIAPKPQTESTN